MAFKKFSMVFVLCCCMANVSARDLIDTSHKYTNKLGNNTGAVRLFYESGDHNIPDDPRNIIGQSFTNGALVGNASLMGSAGLSKLHTHLTSENQDTLDVDMFNISNSKYVNNSITTLEQPTYTPGIIGTVMYIDRYLSGDVNISSSLFENNIGTSGGRVATLGGAIASFLGNDTLYITNSTFKDNSIQNIAGTIFVSGDIDLPKQSGYLTAGGAIFTTTKANISNSSFIGNSAYAINQQARGGAIANYGGTVLLKDSSFFNNKVSSDNYEAIGGAISNTQKDDKDGGAILTIVSQNSDVIFSGNTMKGKGDSSEVANDIYNKGGSTVNLNAGSSRRIVFNGGIDGDGLTNNININDPSKATDVNSDGTIVFNNTVQNNTINAYGGTIQLGLDGTDSSKFVVAGKYFKNVTIKVHGNFHLSLQNGVIDDIDLDKIEMVSSRSRAANDGRLSLSIDADFSNNTLDNITTSTKLDSSTKFNISGIRVINDNPGITSASIDLGNLIANIGGSIGDLPDYAYGSIYKYGLNFDGINLLSFTARSGSASDFSPYLYNQTVSLRQLSNIQHYISESILSRALYSIDDKSKEAKKKPAVWFDLIASREDSKYDNFDTVKGDYYNALLGVDTGAKYFTNGILFGNVYLGYLSGDHKYSSSKLDSNGIYIGGSIVGEVNNFIAGLTANIGYLTTDAKNDYGKDSYDNKWFSIGSKIGYEFKLVNNYSIEPAIYLSYMFITADTYTSDSGVRMSGDSLNSFQVAPGVSLSKMFQNQFSFSVKAKYVAEIVNDLNSKASSILLPELTDDPFIEYGIGIDKKVRDVFSFGVDLNRRDGGRRGWIGGVNAKIFF